MHIGHLPDLLRQHIVGSYLDTNGRQALAQTCRQFRDEVETTLSPAERFLKSAWLSIDRPQDPLVAEVEDALQPEWRGPAAILVAALSLYSTSEAMAQASSERNPSTARRQRYDRLRRNLRLAADALDGYSSLRHRPTEAQHRKLALLMMMADFPDAWPPQTLSIVAKSPCALGLNTEPKESAAEVRALQVDIFSRYPWILEESSAARPDVDWTLVYPTAVHPDFMQGDVMWGIEDRDYIYIAVSGRIARPDLSGDTADRPFEDTIYTCSWTPTRGNLRWECASYSRSAKKRQLDGGMYPSFGFYMRPIDFQKISDGLQRAYASRGDQTIGT